MTGNDYDICKSFAQMDENIMGAGIIDNMKVVAIYSKQIVPMPKWEKFEQLVIQPELFVSMDKSNADLFGRFRYFSMSYECIDIILFLIPNGRSSSDNEPRLLDISVSRPNDMTKLLEKLHIIWSTRRRKSVIIVVNTNSCLHVLLCLIPERLLCLKKSGTNLSTKRGVIFTTWQIAALCLPVN